MTRDQMLAYLRDRVGAPSKDQVPDRRLEGFLVSSLEWLAPELDFRVEEVEVSLVASRYTYPLPGDFLQALWVEWDERRLDPASVRGWVRDGTDWRNATAAEPREYAVEGQSLLLYPPPDSDAVTTDGAATLSYLASAPEVGEHGVTGLSEPDLWCAIYRAAADYLGANPGGTTEELAANGIRRQAAEASLARALPEAKRRHADRIRPPHARIKVWSARTGGAR